MHEIRTGIPLVFLPRILLVYYIGHLIALCKRETDYETLMEAFTADSESDEYSEQSDEDSETLQRQWLQLQQIEE